MSMYDDPTQAWARISGDAITIDELREDNERLVDALRRVYMWVSPAALAEDPDTASVEARRICREVLGMEAE